jgi:two-component system sensor histidine kinase and response regulator WspE
MNNEAFTDSAMLEMFRAEVETHVESLTAGLLALERDPSNTSHIDEMMRAAHSIKGAARIVGIEPAVRVAHVMEDGFIAAQNGKLKLRSAHVDVLLRGVDMLNRLGQGSKEAAIDWNLFAAEVTPLVAEITAALSSSPEIAASNAIANDLSVPRDSSPLDPAKRAEVTIPLPTMFDAAAAESARLAFIAGLDAKATVLRFDLSMTSDLVATGLAFLAAASTHANSKLRVELAGTRAELKAVLQATGIDRLYSAGGR